MSEDDTFYSALGRAIAQWASVEHSLFELYSTIMKPQIWIVLSATYHVPTSFKTKLDIVDMAIKSSYSHESYNDLRAKWKTLYNKLNAKSKKRNDIAHLMVINDLEEGLYMRPAILDAKALIKEDYKVKKYNTEQLKTLKSTFGRLSCDIDELKQSLPTK